MAQPSTLARLPLPMKFAMGVGLLLLVAVAYFVVFYGEISNSIKGSRTQEGRLRGELAEALKAQSVYQEDLKELAVRESRRQQLNKVLPATTQYPAFLSAIQNAANISGVSLAAWTPLAEVREKFYARVPMRIELSGRFHQVAKFFYAVGQLDRIINIENISMSRPRVKDEDIFLSIEALATAFRSLDESKAGGDDRRARAKKGRKQ